MNPLQLRLQLSQRVPSPKMLSWSLFQLWPSLELWVLFSFSAPVVHSGNLTRVRSATDCVVVPGVGLLARCSWCCCRRCVRIVWRIDLHSWNRSHQDGFTVTANFQRSSSRDWCRFPRIPDHGVQESRVPTPSLHSAFQRTTTNHAVRCTDQMLICFAVTSEPNAFEPCGFQFVDQCSWSSTRNCLLQRARQGFGQTCVESSRKLLSLSLVFCGISCIAMLRVVVTE